MSFDAIEKSSDFGAPFELYEFRYGDEDALAYRYTNADRDLTRLGHTWFARPITREAYRSSGKTDDKSSLTIRMPVDTDLSSLFTDFPPPQVVRVTIWAGHMTDPDEQVLVIWTGRVLSVAKERNQALLTCDNTIISLKRPGLRRNWQYLCPYVLYGPMCGATMRGVESQVVNVTTTGIVLEAGWWGSIEPEKFKGGMIRWRGGFGLESRTIRDARDDGFLQFLGPLRDIEEGQKVSLFLGCNHTMSDCRSLHNNINNYGGDPWIPLKNPVRNHPYW